MQRAAQSAGHRCVAMRFMPFLLQGPNGQVYRDRHLVVPMHMVMGHMVAVIRTGWDTCLSLHMRCGHIITYRWST